MGIKNRRPIYFRSNKDEDILDYIKPLLKKHSFSFTVRELIRDGIKYRKFKNNNVLQSNTFANISYGQNQINDEILKDKKLKKAEVSHVEIEDRLDNF